MTLAHRSLMCNAPTRLISIVLVSIAMAGCGEKTLVAEGDPVVRRKQKEDALNKMLNPTGAPPAASKAKGKVKSSAEAAKNKAIDEMYLP